MRETHTQLPSCSRNWKLVFGFLFMIHPSSCSCISSSVSIRKYWMFQCRSSFRLTKVLVLWLSFATTILRLMKACAAADCFVKSQINIQICLKITPNAVSKSLVCLPSRTAFRCMQPNAQLAWGSVQMFSKMNGSDVNRCHSYLVYEMDKGFLKNAFAFYSKTRVLCIYRDAHI